MKFDREAAISTNQLEEISASVLKDFYTNPKKWSESSVENFKELAVLHEFLRETCISQDEPLSTIDTDPITRLFVEVLLHDANEVNTINVPPHLSIELDKVKKESEENKKKRDERSTYYITLDFVLRLMDACKDIDYSRFFQYIPAPAINAFIELEHFTDLFDANFRDMCEEYKKKNTWPLQVIFKNFEQYKKIYTNAFGQTNFESDSSKLEPIQFRLHSIPLIDYFSDPKLPPEPTIPK